MKQLEVQINVRNNLLKERRAKLGFTQFEMAEYIDIPHYVYICFENLKRPKISARLIQDYKQKVVNYFECVMCDVFPPELESVKNSKVIKKIDMNEVHRIYYERDDQYLLDSQKNMEHWHGADKEVERALSTLSEREMQVIMLRYGIKTGLPRTYKELSDIFGVCSQRVRQIEAKAIRKLRHPSRSRVLKQFVCSEKEYNELNDKYLEERRKQQAIFEQRRREEEILNNEFLEKCKRQQQLFDEYKKNRRY